ncbi:MAG: YbaB/EbfC family nucleoid-associated protein [Rhodococcus sp. (in: high G+C Gram-positive bacteria)]|uniref:YbaB/EbfC family nucleoid-associated protein n=1 Tax=Rhodococcus sp. TaxID=1831 RepID=UPI003BAE5AD3
MLESDDRRARNDDLRCRIDSMLDTLQRQRQDLDFARVGIAGITGEGFSADGLVRVGVDAAGVLTGVTLASDAFRRTTPEHLGRSMTAAAQQAVAEARSRTAELMAPVLDARGELPDLSEIVPGAPGLHDLLPPLPVPQPETGKEDRWGHSILRGAGE